MGGWVGCVANSSGKKVAGARGLLLFSLHHGPVLVLPGGEGLGRAVDQPAAGGIVSCGAVAGAAQVEAAQ